MAILEFKRRQQPASSSPMVWQCSCGSFAFWLYQTGEAVCQECEHTADTMAGFWRIPEAAPKDAG